MLSRRFSSFCHGTIRNCRRSRAGSFLFLVLAELLALFDLPFLDNAVASRSKCSCTFYCCKKSVFSSLVVADNSIPVVWKTPTTAVPVIAVVLEHSLCGWVKTIHRSSSNPPLPTMLVYTFLTACLCSQASVSMMAKFGLCCSCKTLSYRLSALYVVFYRVFEKKVEQGALFDCGVANDMSKVTYVGVHRVDTIFLFC